MRSLLRHNIFKKTLLEIETFFFFFLSEYSYDYLIGRFYSNRRYVYLVFLILFINLSCYRYTNINNTGVLIKHIFCFLYMRTCCAIVQTLHFYENKRGKYKNMRT